MRRLVRGLVRSNAVLVLCFFAASTLISPNAGSACDTATVVFSGVDFGIYSRAAGNQTTALLSLQCAGLPGTEVMAEIQLSPGENAAFPKRAVADPESGHQLNYNLYVDAAASNIWGDGSGGTQTVVDVFELTLPLETREYTLFGRIPPGQNTAPGLYRDSVVITVLF